MRLHVDIGAALAFLAPPGYFTNLRRAPRLPARGAAQPNCRADLRHRVRRGAIAFIYPVNQK